MEGSKETTKKELAIIHDSTLMRATACKPANKRYSWLYARHEFSLRVKS